MLSVATWSQMGQRPRPLIAGHGAAAMPSMRRNGPGDQGRRQCGGRGDRDGRPVVRRDLVVNGLAVAADLEWRGRARRRSQDGDDDLQPDMQDGRLMAVVAVLFCPAPGVTEAAER